MKAPGFWYQPPGFWSAVLAGEAAFWRFAMWVNRRMTAPEKVQVPVICVGNPTVGGSGKTPVVMALAVRLREQKLKPFILLRGYGGRIKGPHRVDLVMDRATDVGDEALLHAVEGPVIVSADRIAGAKAAIAQGADIILMDDGFQNPSLAKDLSILVIDSNRGLGNGRVIPAGPLREPWTQAQALAQAVMVLNGPNPITTHLPVLTGRIEPIAPERVAGRRLFAFAGIGDPEKFFASLGKAGAMLAGVRAFADHHPYGQGELDELRAAAASTGADLITTAKDLARLGPMGGGIESFPVAVRFDDQTAIDALLAPWVQAAKASA